jgi:hypothetical protein
MKKTLKTLGAIQKLGGRESVYNKLRALGYKVGTIDTVRMWETRGSIAGKAIPVLMDIANRESIILHPTDFCQLPDSQPAG